MCASGRRSGSPSTSPRRIRTVSGSARDRLQSGEPQVPQKQRHLPGDDSNSRTRSVPVTTVRYLVRTGALVTKGPPALSGSSGSGRTRTVRPCPRPCSVPRRRDSVRSACRYGYRRFDGGERRQSAIVPATTVTAVPPISTERPSSPTATSTRPSRPTSRPWLER